VQLQLERMVLPAMLVQKTDDQSEIFLQGGKTYRRDFLKPHHQKIPRRSDCNLRNVRLASALVLVPATRAREITRKYCALRVLDSEFPCVTLFERSSACAFTVSIVLLCTLIIVINCLQL
jgi:hypothetical protein